MSGSPLLELFDGYMLLQVQNALGFIIEVSYPPLYEHVQKCGGLAKKIRVH